MMSITRVRSSLFPRGCKVWIIGDLPVGAAAAPESIGRGVESPAGEGDSETVLLGKYAPEFDEEAPGGAQPGVVGTVGLSTGRGLLMPGVGEGDVDGVAILPGAGEVGGGFADVPPVVAGGAIVDGAAAEFGTPVDVGRGAVRGSTGPGAIYDCPGGTAD